MKVPKIFFALLLAIFAGVAFSSCSSSDGVSVTIVSGSGDISSLIAQYQALLGNPNNLGTPGQQASGRREINWDAVPAGFTNVDTFPGNFFNGPASPRARGVVFSTPGTGFRVSDNNFADIDPSFGTQFSFFSSPRTFMSVGSNVTDIEFFVAGSSTPASVSGFGVIFTDVELAGSTTIEYFDGSDSLGQFEVQVRSDGTSFSFLGAFFPDRRVTNVRIVSGQSALIAGELDISDGGSFDLVVMDDFLYGEPIALP